MRLYGILFRYKLTLRLVNYIVYALLKIFNIDIILFKIQHHM